MNRTEDNSLFGPARASKQERLGKWVRASRGTRAAAALSFCALLLLAWQAAGMMGWLPRYVLSPVEIALAVVEYTANGTLIVALQQSLPRMVLGFVIGTGTGVVVGLLAGTWRIVENAIDPLVSLTYPVPKIAFFPVIAVWLGYSDRARVLVIALACFYPAFINALSGTRGLDRRYILVARNLEAGTWRTFWQVTFPGSLPRVLAGVRISLALSFIMLFATEVIASTEGLGFQIFQGYLNVQYDLMYSAVATLALLGFLSDRLLVFVGRRATRGQDIETGSRWLA
jgi:ABC-type nitrate/sulfonate/bicarbonate transport system permease component